MRKDDAFARLSSYAEANRAIGLVRNVRQVKGRERVNFVLFPVEVASEPDYKEKFEKLKRLVEEGQEDYDSDDQRAIGFCVVCDAIGCGYQDRCHKCKQSICHECIVRADNEPLDSHKYRPTYYCHLCEGEESDTEYEKDYEVYEITTGRYGC